MHDKTGPRTHAVIDILARNELRAVINYEYRTPTSATDTDNYCRPARFGPNAFRRPVQGETRTHGDGTDTESRSCIVKGLIDI